MLNQSTRKIINVDGSNLIPIYTFKQEDDAVLLLSLFKNSTPLDVTGQTVTLGIKRPNGTLVNLEALEGDNPFTIDSNNLDIKLKNSVLSVPGLIECDLELVDVNGKMTTASFYITVNRKVVGNTNIQATNDIAILNKIKLEEEAREVNENAREETEVIRSSNETNRVASENTRETKEDGREEAESIRNNQETVRASNEINREENENIRSLNESKRIENENTRVLKEEERTISENDRNTNEDTRNSNELLRVGEENYRVTKEEARKINEENRASNESSRQAKEQERITEEETRKTNELSRQTAYKEIENARKDFNGVLRDNLLERISADMSYVNDRFNKASLLEYDSNYITANKSYDGVTKDLKIKGNTLQNIAEENITEYGTSGASKGISTERQTDNGKFNGAKWIIIDNTIATFRTVRLKKEKMLKPNTTYTLNFTIVKDDFLCSKTFTISGNHDSYNGQIYNKLFSGDYVIGVNRVKFTTPSDVSTYTGIGFGFPSLVTGISPNGAETIIKDISLLEGDYTNKPIPQILNGIKSVGEDGNKVEVISYGKNLFSNNKSMISSPNTFHSVINNNKNGYDITSVANNSGWVYTIFKLNFKFKPNTTYRLGCEISKSNPNARPCIRLFDSFRKIPLCDLYLNGNNQFATTNYVEGIYLYIYSSIDNIPSTQGDTFSFNNICIEEVVDSNYKYEPYKEDKISIPLPEPLRSLPSGVCDEIDLERGKIIRRVGKIVLNGSEINWAKVRTDLMTTLFSIDSWASINNCKPNTELISNSFKKGTGTLIDEESIVIGNHLNVRISNNKLTAQDIAGFKAWLQSNQVTVYYELVTPIETLIELPNNLRTYDSVTNITTQGSLIEPNVYCKIPSDVVTTLDIRHSTVKNKLFGSADERVEELEKDVKNIVTQEAWITPTLLNGWLAFDDSSTIKYRKNKLNNVYITGMVKGGSGIIFQLPTNYRPIIPKRFAVIANNSLGYVAIDSFGNVSLVSGNNSYVSLDIDFLID